MSVSPSYFDDSPHPQPSPSPATAKAVHAAANIQKVRKKIAGKQSVSRGKTNKHFAKRYMSSSSSIPSSSKSKKGKVTQPKRKEKPAPAKRAKRWKKMKHDNFFDENSDDDTDDSKIIGRGHDEDEEDSVAERVEVRSVDFSGIDDGDEDEDIVGRHRQVFFDRAFGEDEDHANNAICRPEAEIQHIIFVLQHWEVDMVLKSIDDPEHYRAVKEFRETHKYGYKWVRTFWIQDIELPDGSSKTILRRKEAKYASGGRIVVSREYVFDAIDEWHRKRGHLGQERTHAFCKDKYYNCTQALVKIYCETCHVCMKKNPTVAAMKGSRKPIRSNGFRDRYQVDLIDFRKMRKRDPFGVLMRWVVTIKDHCTGFTHISAIPRKTAKYVAHRLQEFFGLVGYPSIFHTDNGKEFTARLILKFLRQLNPSIITVTGRPRQPSDQGSVESMNRFVKRIIGSELAERRLAGENPNWTEILGSVVSTINSQHGRSANSTSAYKAIFGQSYDQDVSCSLEEARLCWSVDERLKVMFCLLLSCFFFDIKHSLTHHCCSRSLIPISERLLIITIYNMKMTVMARLTRKRVMKNLIGRMMI